MSTVAPLQLPKTAGIKDPAARAAVDKLCEQLKRMHKSVINDLDGLTKMIGPNVKMCIDANGNLTIEKKVSGVWTWAHTIELS